MVNILRHDNKRLIDKTKLCQATTKYTKQPCRYEAIIGKYCLHHWHYVNKIPTRSQNPDRLTRYRDYGLSPHN